MKEKSQYNQLIALAIPAILSQLSHTLVGLADTIMIGQTGNVSALAASALANNVLSVPIVFLVGISYASTPKIAEFFARKEVKNCQSILFHSLLLNTIWGLLVCAFLWFLLPFAYKLDQEPKVLALAIPFFGYLIASLPGLVLFQSFRQFYDGLGNTKPGMVVSILANLLNVVLNYALIFGKFGFPEMGIIGAGISNLISRWVMGVGLMLFFIFEQNSMKWRKGFFSVPVRLKEFSNLNKLGIPISLQFLFEVGAFSFTAILVGRMGEISLAAHQIVITLASMTYMMASGIASASTIRIGHFVGLGDKEKILETGKKSMVLVIIFMSFTAALFLLFKTQIPLLFIEKEEVVLAAASLFSIAALFQISDGIQVVGLGCLRGLSDVKVPTLLTLFAYWVIAIPLGYWLGISQNMGLNGTWFGLFIGLTISAICMLLRFYLIARKFKIFIDINE